MGRGTGARVPEPPPASPAVALDGAVGSVPLAGDLLDDAFKANRRNVRLLRRHLERNGNLRPSEIEGTAVRLD